jgi:hypothetical protein
MRRRKFTRGLAGAAWQVIVGEALPTRCGSGGRNIWLAAGGRLANTAGEDSPPNRGEKRPCLFLQHWYRHGGTTC